MKANFVTTMAVMLFLISTTEAKAADTAPAICENLANYAAQILVGTTFTEKIYDSKGHNPHSLNLKSDFKNFKIGKVTDLGNCDENANLPETYCSGFGGGSFEIYNIEVTDSTGQYPEAEVVVNYNSRGACIVREVSVPKQQP